MKTNPTLSEIAEDLKTLSPGKERALRSLLRREGLDPSKVREALLALQQPAFALTFCEHRLWHLCRMNASNPCTAEAWLALISGSLQEGLMVQGLGRLLQLQPRLRSAFPLRDAGPVRLAGNFGLELARVDLSALPAPRRRPEAERVAAFLAGGGFELFRGPLLRAVLCRLGPQGNALALGMHLLLAEGGGQARFFRQLSSHYEALFPGAAAHLPDGSGSPAVQDGDRERGLAEWRRRQADELPVLELLTDRPRPAFQSLRGARHPFCLAPGLSDDLKRLSRRSNVRLSALLSAAFRALLLRYTGQEDVALAFLDQERQAGPPRIVRSCLSRQAAFDDFLQGFDDLLADALQCGGLGLDDLAELLQLEPEYSRAPLAQALFQWAGEGGSAWRRAGLDWNLLQVGPPSAVFDLALNLTEYGGALRGLWVYAVDLFDEPTIARLASHFSNLLGGVAANPGQSLARLPLLSEAERRQILQDWDRTSLEGWQPSSVHTLFGRQVARQPDAIAVSLEGRLVSYAGLNRQANRIVQGLRFFGSAGQGTAAILLTSPLDQIIALTGILKSGHAFACLDPKHPSARLNHILKEVRPAWLIADLGGLSRHSALIREYLRDPDCRVMALDLRENLSSLSEWGHGLVGRNRLEALPEIEWAAPDRPEKPAYIAFTSGSTGRPKGILHTHQSFGAFLHWFAEQFELGSGTRVGQWASITFDPCYCEIFGALCYGATVCPAPPDAKADPPAVVEWLRRESVTFFEVVPSFGRHLLQSLQSEEGYGSKPPLPSLQYLNFVGEALPVELVWHILSSWPRPPQPANLYGPTEAVVATCHMIGQVDPSQRSIPVGRPIDGCQVLILDAEGQLCPVGIKGEVYIRSRSLAQGYFRRPEETRRSFLRNPFHQAPPDRMYRTGDLARWLPSGEVEFFGRKDFQVKVRGVRVELEDVEATLRRHPEIKECVVAAYDFAQGDTRLVGYVVGNGEQHDDESTLLASQTRHVAQCRDLYDGIYSLSPSFSARDEGINRRVWTTGANQSFSEEEVWEVVEDSARQILAAAPQRILEVGCGSGLLLFRLAGHCERYHATDISESALQYLRGRLERHSEKFAGLHVEERAAHDFEGIQPGAYDAVVLSFVSMHFPDADYLVRFLEQAVEATAPAGFVFIGGVRSLPLLEAFHTSVQLQQAPDELSLEELRRRVRQRLDSEKDLIVDPALFEAFARQSPKVRFASIQPIGGRLHNELTRYLYDVILYVEGGEQQKLEVRWADWRESGLSPQSLELPSNGASGLGGLADLPNARLSRDLAALRMVREGVEEMTVGDVRRALLQAELPEGFDPFELRRRVREAGGALQLDWSCSGAEGRFDAVFRMPSNGQAFFFRKRQPAAERKWQDYANNPLQGTHAGHLVPRLRAYLKENLPEQYVPSAFVVLDKLPRNPNGKVDRKALPRPGKSRPDLDGDYLAPRTPLEAQIAEVWREMLQLERCGALDDFFESGGHSLLATQLVGRLRKLFSVQLPVRRFFEAPTIAGLAESIEEERAAGREENERVARLLRKVQQLSESDLQALMGGSNDMELAEQES